MTDFLGWSSWSEWSTCSSDGIRVRHRRCEVEQPTGLECRGAEFEKTACVPGECDGTLCLEQLYWQCYPESVCFLSEVRGASSATLATVICLMLLITVACCLAIFHFTRRRFLLSAEEALNKTTTTTASFDTYPNQYSSLPTKDVSAQGAIALLTILIIDPFHL